MKMQMIILAVYRRSAAAHHKIC